MTSFAFHMPTRIVAGQASLSRLPDLLRDLGVRRALLVTDPIIARQGFAVAVRDAMDAAGLLGGVDAACGVDARVAQCDDLAQRIVAQGIDGVVGLGGGSVICAAKAAALAAANGCDTAALKGVVRHAKPPLPQIMIPTTAGSGSEVSQWSLVKDDARHEKYGVGGPQCFPDIALLDPATLATLPRRPAALAAVDALSHAVEAMFTDSTSPVSDALALAAIRHLSRSLRASILDGDAEARLENLLGASLANMACGNARLGLCHALFMPIEAEFGVEHGLGMAALLPGVFAFNAVAAPTRAAEVIAAFGLETHGTPQDLAGRLEAHLHALYVDLGIPPRLPAAALDRARLPEMATRAVTSLARGRAVPPVPHGPATLIVCPNIRPASVEEGSALLEAAMA